MKVKIGPPPKLLTIDIRIARQRAKLDRIETRLAHLMSQRALEEERLADLLKLKP